MTERPIIDVDTVPARGFALADELPPFHGEWHTHRPHQLLFAVAGTLHLEVGDRLWTLPPARAAWLPGGVAHRVSAPRGCALRTVYLEPSWGGPAQTSVFEVTELARAMIDRAMRWGPARSPDEDAANRFFQVLSDCCGEWAARPLPFHLPRTSGPVRRALDATLADLAGASLERAASAAGLSTRTLARRLRAEANMTWREVLNAARMLRAMELLDGDHPIIEVALDVGFDSPGAFSHAFRRWCGERPRDYRRRSRG